MTFDDILSRLANHAFDRITENLGSRTGMYFCPRDRIPMVRLQSGFYYCPTCETKFAREAPQRAAPPGMDGSQGPEADAFRPFNPFSDVRNGRRPRRPGDAMPPRTGRPSGNPNKRRAPPPRAPRAVHADPITEAYRELDLSPPVTADAVKKRRRELALLHHPDHGGDGIKLARVNAAADLLLQVL